MNRSLAAKAKKARIQARDFAVERSLCAAQEPSISKEYARWEDGQAHLALPVGAINYVRGRRYRKPARDFLTTEAQTNVLRTHEVLGVFSQKTSLEPPKFVGVKENEDGELVVVRPLNASTGAASDWARRNGVQPDVGMSHVLRFYDDRYDRMQAQARMDRADLNARQER